jgi:GxxExxY protein
MMTGPQRHRDTELNALTHRIIGCAIEVHRVLGPGLLEPNYESALSIELSDAGLTFKRQVLIPALYKGRLIGRYRIDLIVEEQVIVEVKATERMHPLYEAQLLTYLRVTKKRIGLLINFNSRLLTEGVQRVVL